MQALARAMSMPERSNKVKNLFSTDVKNLVLLTPVSCTDGVAVWEEHPVTGRLLHRQSSLCCDEHSVPTDNTVFVIAPCTPSPQAGNRITDDNNTYLITETETPTNLKGSPVCHKCTCRRER